MSAGTLTDLSIKHCQQKLAEAQEELLYWRKQVKLRSDFRAIETAKAHVNFWRGAVSGFRLRLVGLKSANNDRDARGRFQ